MSGSPTQSGAHEITSAVATIVPFARQMYAAMVAPLYSVKPASHHATQVVPTFVAEQLC
jgi:hypothetical protein